MSLSDDKDGLKVFTGYLREAYLGMHLYGKQAEHFDTVARFFVRKLAKYDTEQVINALEKYTSQRNQFPTPSDIIGIIQGRVKRDHAIYSRLERRIKSGDRLTDKDFKYMAKYENQTMDDFE